jgi:HAE1 family hydrophobic/amphiphilic exporter-1
MSLVDLCVRRPVFATMLIVSLVVLGLASYRNLGLDLFPKVDLPTVTITTRLPGASPEEVESQITRKIEEAVNTVNGIDELRSTTIEGQSQVFVTFVLEKDVTTAANDVREKVSGVVSEFPEGTEAPAIEKFDPDAAPVMAIVVSGKRSPREITEIADKQIKRQLEAVKDIGAITLVGDRKREIQVVVDPFRLEAYGLSIQQVKAAIQQQNVEIPGGRLTAGRREVGVRTLGRIETVEAFDDLIVAERQGGPVRIRDVGHAVDGEEEARTLSRLDGRNSVSMLVRKQSGTNTVRVVERVKAKLEVIRTTLPADLTVEVTRDQSRFIKRAVATVQEHLILGAVLASLIVWVFLGWRNWRPALIAALAIPSSIIATFTIMSAAGFTLNNITMLALAVSTGIVIDDAIIVLENIFRHMEEEKRPAMEAAVTGAREIALAVMATTLSLVVIFLPVAFMGGLVGRFWRSFGLTATFAILVSLLVAFTLTPMLASRFLGPVGAGHGTAPGGSGGGSKTARWYGLLEGAYEWLLLRCLQHRFLAIVACLGIVAGTLYLARGASFDLGFDDDNSEFEVVVETPPGSSLAESDAVLRRVEADLKEIPEVEHLFTTIGARGQFQTNVTDGTVWVGLDPLSERRRSQYEIMREARQRLKTSYPDLRVSVQQASLISGGGFRQTPFNMVIRGPELRRLDDASQAIIKRLAAMPGFVDVDTAQARRKPEVQVVIERKKAADLGVRVADIASALRTMVGGEKVGFYREGGEQYDVRVRLAEVFRQDASALAALNVPAAGGRLVRMDNVAHLRDGMSPGQIDRYHQERQVTVAANLDRKALGDAIQEATAVVRELDLPPAYSTSYIGRGKLLAEALYNFLIAFILAIVFIYIVLAAQFESFVHPVTIMVSMFLAIPFGLLTLVGVGISLNIYSIFGMFLLMGIVKKNAILQVDYTNTLRARGMPRFEAQVEADKARLRPILMTTLAIVFGMLPIAVGKGDGSGSRAALAITVVGGQTLCLAITLLMTPVVYSLFDDLRGGRAFGLVRGPATRIREALAWGLARVHPRSGRTT